jgi:hypothetical protein
MITVIGRDWPSKQQLVQALEQVMSTLTDEQKAQEVVVAWGTTREGAINGQRRLDAVEQLTAMRDAGVKVPEFTTDIAQALQWVAEGCLVFGRRRQHTQGRDIVGPRHRRWRRSEFWVKVVPQVTEEWRVHVFRGRSIARGLKHQVEEPWRKMPVRNRKNGWHMRHDVEPSDELRNVAKAAVAAVGYDFGAVDLLVTEGGEVFALEVNKAPGLDDYTAAAYAKAIGKVAKRKAREARNGT